MASEDEEERKLGNALSALRKKLKPYEGKNVEEIDDEEDRKILEIVRKLDEEYAFGKFQSHECLGIALKIESWCKANYLDKELLDRKLPNPRSEDEEERKLGISLRNLRTKLKQYEGIKLEEIENEEDRRILEIIKRLDDEYNPNKSKQQSLQQAKQQRDDAKSKNDQAKELEQEVSKQLKKRGQTHEE